MKRLILIALIQALVGCTGMTKTFLGTTIGAVAGYQLGKTHEDQDWAIGLGALTGLMLGRY